MERVIKGLIVAIVAYVLLAGGVLVWQANRLLLSEGDLAGGPACPTITHADALRQRLEFPWAATEDRDPREGVLVNVIGTRKRCTQIGRHASCGLDGAGYVRVRADTALSYFALQAGEAGLLDVNRGRIQCVLAEPAAVNERFGKTVQVLPLPSPKRD